MPGARRAKKGQTARGRNSEQKSEKMWDKKSLQEFDGRANTQAGDKGKEPGGRWSPPAWESGPKIITRDDVRDA